MSTPDGTYTRTRALPTVHEAGHGDLLEPRTTIAGGFKTRETTGRRCVVLSMPGPGCSGPEDDNLFSRRTSPEA